MILKETGHMLEVGAGSKEETWQSLMISMRMVSSAYNH